MTAGRSRSDPDDPQGQDSVSFHWVDGGNHAVTYSVDLSGQVFSGQAAFNVSEPTSHSLENWTKLNGNRGNPEPTSPMSSIPTSLTPEWKSDIDKVKDDWQDVPLDNPPVDPPQTPVPQPW